MIKHHGFRFLVSFSLPFLLSGCELLSLQQQQGGRIHSIPDPMPTYIPEPPMGPWWQKELTCNGPQGAFNVELSSDDYYGNSYNIKVQNSAGSNTSFAVGLDNSQGTYVALSGTVSSTGSYESNLSQTYLDSLPNLVISASGAANPIDPAHSNICQLPQMDDLKWHPDMRAPLAGSVLKASLQDNSSATNVLQLAVSGSKLVMSGLPFGLEVLDISNPQAPTVQFRAASNIANFANGLLFNVDHDASKGLVILGNSILSIGSQNLDMYDDSSIANTKLVYQQAADAGVVGVVTQANAAHFYVAHASGSIKHFEVSASSVFAVDEQPVGSTISSVAPGNGAMYIATVDGLAYYPFNPDGTLPDSSYQLSIGVDMSGELASSSQYIFYYPPASSLSHGYFVFDHSGKVVGFLPLPAPVSFAVSADGKTLYANEDGTALKVYQLTF